jgi:hypothetical protein
MRRKKVRIASVHKNPHVGMPKSVTSVARMTMIIRVYGERLDGQVNNVEIKIMIITIPSPITDWLKAEKPGE